MSSLADGQPQDGLSFKTAATGILITRFLSQMRDSPTSYVLVEVIVTNATSFFVSHSLTHTYEYQIFKFPCYFDFV